MSCLSGLASQIVYWNPQSPEISSVFNPYNFLNQKMLYSNQETPEISAGIKLHHIYHV